MLPRERGPPNHFLRMDTTAMTMVLHPWKIPSWQGRSAHSLAQIQEVAKCLGDITKQLEGREAGLAGLL